MADFTHCDSEFVEVGEDLDMTNFGAVKTLPLSPIKYVPPDITRELAMLEQYAQKGEKLMSKFVQFFAKGIIYDRDKKGRPCGIKESRKGGA